MECEAQSCPTSRERGATRALNWGALNPALLYPIISAGVETFASRSDADFDRGDLAGRQDLVDEAVANRLIGGHEEVAIGIADDALLVLTGALDQNAIDQRPQSEDLPRLDLHVGGLAADAAERLVHVDRGVGQGVALPLGAGRQEDRRHAGAGPDAD